ncbi:GAF domain-containing protein [Dysgonomonas sp. HDW5A]|uniref:GAF domain-containing protein n=1 Tax=unclassified Dysgonomonas TaxID=2630389 RepID=UPI00140D66EB|nr:MULTISPECIES: GAF domain-containing protein [unclassified Dysgonomonas]QIK55747.1 GAF domain-containing protein [Dysgonomonas sp. HDW5B]QIK61144.1 GAF domain-containing protein [Dysgonomonas sp. HDW5A]
MAEKIDVLKDGSREEQYQNILPQIKALLEGESDTIANLANISAVLKEAFSFLWVGFYIVKGEQLVLGPFQGRIACTRINYGKGVCGTAWKENRTITVADVNTFAGHIACDSESRSEIVIPIQKQGKVVAVLDVDSEIEANFSEVDAKYLQEIVCILENIYS